MSKVAVVVALFACGCIESQLVICGVEACPVGNVCTPAGCATPEAGAVCADRSDGEVCTTTKILEGTCIGGRCQPVACGNAVVDQGEVCDDGNVTSGDGCSAACDSLETCGNGIVDLATEEECDSGVAGLSGDGCSSRCFVEPELWREIVPGAISPRTRAAAAYDALDQMIVFGGLDDTGLLGDTWRWDDGWTRLAPTSAPDPRHSAAVAFDLVRGRVVLFGGFGQTGALGDTWEWNGVDWEQRATTGPAPRSAASAAYDRVRQRVVLFGGRGAAGELGDTWEWDGTSWQAVATAVAPPPSSDHTMAYADDSQLVFYYGGAGETWTYDGTDWVAVATSEVVIPSGARLIWNEELSQIELIGIDSTSSGFLSAYAWTGTTWDQQSADTGAAARTDFAVFSDTSCGCVTLMLGANPDATALFNDVWELDTSSGDQWELFDVSSSAPAPRIDHAMAFDTRRGQGVMAGGQGPGADHDATWLWSGGRWTVASSSLERHGHAMVYDPIQDRVIAHGGFGRDGFSVVLDGKTLAWDGASWQTLVPAASPPPRTEHAMTYDAARARIVLFGGYDTTTRADTWEWDGVTWTERTLASAPPSRERHAMAFDTSRGRLVLFGGRDGSGQALGDTWEYDGAWHDVTPAQSPAARFDHAMVYDPLRARVVLVGGDLFGTDTWEWNGSTWELRAPANPPHDRLGGAMFYDTVAHQAVLFGGNGARYFGETYVRTFELAGQTDTCVGADSDGDGLAGCADPDCAGRVECQ